MIVKCDACQGELSTTEEGLRLGRRSKCPKCSTDLRPTHDDPALVAQRALCRSIRDALDAVPGAARGAASPRPG